MDLRFILSYYREFLKIVVPILNKDGVRIGSIGTLFLLCGILPLWSTHCCSPVCVYSTEQSLGNKVPYSNWLCFN